MARVRVRGAACLALMALAGVVEAGPVYTFTRVTSNSSTDVASTLSFEVNNGGNQAGTNFVLFTFRNTGTTDSKIHEIYFEDGALLGLADTHWGSEGDALGYSGNVNFVAGPNPADPPGLGSFDASASFSAGANGQAGLNGGEWVTFRYSLQAGLGYSDVLAALQAGLDGPDVHPMFPDRYSSLRVALHVGGLPGSQPDSESDTFLYSGPDGNPIPLPGAAAMSAAGLLVVARRRRRL